MLRWGNVFSFAFFRVPGNPPTQNRTSQHGRHQGFSNNRLIHGFLPLLGFRQIGSEQYPCRSLTRPPSTITNKRGAGSRTNKVLRMRLRRIATALADLTGTTRKRITTICCMFVARSVDLEEPPRTKIPRPARGETRSTSDFPSLVAGPRPSVHRCS